MRRGSGGPGGEGKEDRDGGEGKGRRKGEARRKEGGERREGMVYCLGELKYWHRYRTVTANGECHVIHATVLDFTIK